MGLEFQTKVFLIYSLVNEYQETLMVLSKRTLCSKWYFVISLMCKIIAKEATSFLEMIYMVEFASAPTYMVLW